MLSRPQDRSRVEDSASPRWGMDIIVIYTNKGNPGIIDQPERDEKNMMRTKEKRPRHPMQEDIESLPLYLNPVLEPLALCLCARRTNVSTCVISPEGADVRFKTTCNPSVMERVIGWRSGWSNA
ncbi:predicted protein [Histoplasma capsulatum H143]|uniref:Uncharacterized protein n=1 Tax=Ajellomyces capsulatus (strain H143) TaxID=544712 RepID=C6H2Y8_AJECH|nr:predicted protein [Histoplasma capsulatum H143]